MTAQSKKGESMTGKQRVEEILQKYSNAVVDEAVEKCVGGGIVVFAERAKAKRLEALDSIEEVIKEVLGEDTLPEEHELSRSKYFTQNNLRAEQLKRWSDK